MKIPPKKSPAAVTSEPQDIELEDQIRLRAYELYEVRPSSVSSALYTTSIPPPPNFSAMR
jgi:hypothetical protein